MAKFKRYKPKYKKFLFLQKNILNSPKFFKFKKKKWERFKFFASIQTRFFKRYRFRDQSVLCANRYAANRSSYKKKFKMRIKYGGLIKTFYGGFRKKTFKKILSSIKKNVYANNKNAGLEVIGKFEKRLDVTLTRARFCFSVKSARQMISHGHILVNKLVVKSYSYELKNYDFVEIGPRESSKKLVRKNLGRSNFWPIPPNYLEINYKTLQIITLYDKIVNERFLFSYQLRSNYILNNFKF